MTFIDMIELYNIRKNNELNDINSIFEDIVLDNRIDKNAMIASILDQCGAMECIYNTTGTFKFYSDNFFKKYQWNISKLVDTLNFEYDPLKDRRVEWTETTDIKQDLDTVENKDEDATRKNTGTQGEVYSEEETNTISAMNSNSYQPDTKREREGSNTVTNNLTEKYDASTDRTKNEDLQWDETDQHTESGTVNNSYQELIQQERKQAMFNIYNWISEKYAKELFLLVY